MPGAIGGIIIGKLPGIPGIAKLLALTPLEFADWDPLPLAP
jgi:hypothetical protein